MRLVEEARRRPALPPPPRSEAYKEEPVRSQRTNDHEGRQESAEQAPSDLLTLEASTTVALKSGERRIA